MRMEFLNRVQKMRTTMIMRNGRNSRKRRAEGRKSQAKTAAGKANPKKHATVAEVEDRVIETMTMVIKGRSTADVKRFLCGKYNIVWQTALRYLRVARERLREENGLIEEFTLDDMKAQHYAIFMDIVQNSEKDQDRIAALRRAGAIYGVEAARNVTPTTQEVDKPHDLKVTAETALRDLSVDELRILKKVRKRMTAILQDGKPGAN